MSKQQCNNVTTVPSTPLKALTPDQLFQCIQVGQFVVLKLLQYQEDLPQIGKVIQIDASSVTVNWLVGSYSGTFGYWKEKGKVISGEYPLRAVVCSIKLTPSMKILKNDVLPL